MMTEKERQLQAVRSGLSDAAEAMRFASGHMSSFVPYSSEEAPATFFWERTLRQHADTLNTLETDLAELVEGDGVDDDPKAKAAKKRESLQRTERAIETVKAKLVAEIDALDDEASGQEARE